MTQALQLKRRGLKAAQETVLEFSSQQLPGYFDKLLDELIDLTEQGTFVGSKHEFFYAGSKIKESRDRIADDFYQYFKTTFKKFGARTLDDVDSLLGNNHQEQLALIEEDALEERVVLSSIKQRAEGRFRDELWSLNQRISVLNDGIPVDEQLNPLAPARFCLALREGLKEIDIPAATKAEIYRIFDRLVVDRLGEVYAKTNKALTDLNVLPNLRHSVVKAAERGFSRGMPPPGPVSEQYEAGDVWLGGGGAQAVPQMPAQPGAPVYTNYHRQLYANISTLQDRIQWVSDPQGRSTPDGGIAVVPQVTFANQAGGAGEQAAGNVGLTGLPVLNYSVTDLDQALHSLQQQDLQVTRQALAEGAAMAPRAVAPVAENLLHQLNALLGNDKAEPADIKVADQKTIDLVGMVFRYMLNDNQVPDGVKTLLSYLHMPFLKVACADRQLFEQPEHPARQLLNRLAEAGTRWTGKGKKDRNGVYNRIHDVVERLLEYTGDDINHFEDELTSFNGFLKRIEDKAAIMEKRVAEQAQGEDRLKKAKDQVRVMISNMIGERELPSSLLIFLLQPWTDYLVFVLLRHGKQSDPLKAGVKVARGLLKGLEAGDDERKSRRWKNAYPALKKEIDKGFDAIGFDQTGRKEMVEAMDQVYEKCLQKKRVRPASQKQKKQLVDQFEEDMLNLYQQRQSLTEQEDQYLEQLQNVTVGTWFQGPDGKREKISWYNMDTLQFLLVDHRGHRTAMRSGIELAQMMAAGDIEVLEVDERPLVDRSLEQIYADLCGAKEQLQEADEEKAS